MPERLYFAYGSNMHTAEMLEHCPSAKYVSPARLNGWRLVFTHDSARWLGGVADIVRLGSPEDTRLLDPAGLSRGVDGICPLSPVRGVLWDVDDASLAALHAAQGYDPARPREENDSELLHLEVLELEKMTRRVAAFAYGIVHKEPRHRVPHAGYMDLVVEGARLHGLPEEYWHELRHVEIAGED
jgi:hypothetical protein